MNIDDLAKLTTQSIQQNQLDLLFEMENDIFSSLTQYPLWLPRFHGWYAQAYLQAKKPQRANLHCNTAIRLAKAIQDDKGVKHLRDLREQITALLVVLSAKKKEAGSVLEGAISALEAENIELCKDLAQLALKEAIEVQDPKQEILALLTLAKIPSERTTAIDRAYHRCQEIGDMNLITAVKKTMDELNIEVPKHVF